jgi:hypothetical protein
MKFGLSKWIEKELAYAQKVVGKRIKVMVSMEY